VYPKTSRQRCAGQRPAASYPGNSVDSGCGDFWPAVGSQYIRRSNGSGCPPLRPPVAGKRVHIEDFAQILGLYPEQKYASYNYETLANLVYKLAGESELDEFIRRLVFVIASGNGDAHLKNWSLIYPDGVNARLAPAYDFVSTIQYKADDQLALNLARSKRWQDVTRESFLRLARKIGDDEDADGYPDRARRRSIMTAWHASRGDFGYTAQARDRISSHLARVPLFSAGT
jgi:serine/threonine-protein kinase HipA